MTTSNRPCRLLGPWLGTKQALWVLVALNLLWRLIRYGMNFPLWGDEAFVANNFFNRGFSDMLRPLDHGQIAPVVFMWGELAAARLFGCSEWALRMLPFVVGLASMFLFATLARRLFGKMAALMATGVFAAAYFPMRYGAEVKPYGLDLFLALAIIWLGWNVLSNPGSIGAWMGLIASAAAAIWCSYPSVFVSGGVGIALCASCIQSRNRKAAMGLIILGLCLISSFLLMLKYQAQPQLEASPWLTQMSMWRQAFPPIAEPWRLPWWLIRAHTGELLAYPIGGKSEASAIPFLLAMLGAISLCRRSRGTLVLMLLAPLMLTFIAAAMERYPYGGGPRVSLYMAPAFCLLIGRGITAALARLPHRHAKALGVRLALGVLVVIALVGMIRDVVKPYHMPSDLQNRTVMRAQAEHAAPGDVWVIFNALEDNPHAPNLCAWGGSAARFRYYVSLLAPVRVLWSPRPEQVVRTTDGRIRLMVYRDNKEPFPEEMLDAYLRRTQAAWGPRSADSYPLGSEERIEVFSYGQVSSNRNAS